eukprot:4756983-Amphidinium_carterae.6
MSVERIVPESELLRVFHAEQWSYLVQKESGEVACLGPGIWRLEYSTEGGMFRQLLEGDEEGDIGGSILRLLQRWCSRTETH